MIVEGPTSCHGWGGVGVAHLHVIEARYRSDITEESRGSSEQRDDAS